ncbi:MAG: Rieske (2Fe-2S) protein [Deltaproteobacteria bacterium]|nr:Rieske (2Fe-2S) protein [Deltaproteobacteria bacterium]
MPRDNHRHSHIDRPAHDEALPDAQFEEALQQSGHQAFGSWRYIAHEKEIPNPGDFLSRTLAHQPIIIVRGEDGQVRVLLNICQHRHVRVCRQERGNATKFICADHGWVYNTKGNLIGLSGPDGHARRFSERRGLTPVPRMEIYQGAIFASLSPDGESLAAALGQLRGKEA